MQNKPITILITGDLVLTQNYKSSSIDQPVAELFSQSDLNIVNLEAPVTETVNKHFKLGPYLKADSEATKKVLKRLNVGLATLANNHIFDYGEVGLKDTISFLNDNGIQYVGAGPTKEDASGTLFKEIGGVKFAFINIAENEWSSAEGKSGGAHPFDIVDNVRKIHEAKQGGYKVILIIHGGLEYFNYPIPYGKKNYRFFADQGADLIISHHTHCIGGHEIYNGVPIYYSLGNFLFTKKSRHEDWYLGHVVKVKYEDEAFHTELIGTKQGKSNFELSLLSGDELKVYEDRIKAISETIKDDQKLEEVYQSFLKLKTKQYLDAYSIIPFFKRGLLLKILKKFNVNFHSNYSAAFILNLIRCETHLEVSKSIFKNYIKNDKV